MSTSLQRLLLVAIAAAVGLGAMAAGKWLRASRAVTADPGAVASAASPQGALLYQAHCAHCHGARGHVDPDAVASLQPPPRDFASRPWRFEATPASIRRVIREGIPGTAMSGLPVLSVPQIDAMAAHVMRLAVAGDHERTDDQPAEGVASLPGFRTLRPGPAPPLRVDSAQRREVELADYHGSVVLLNFWGSNCLPCLKAMPTLASLASEHADRGLVVLSICADQTDAATAATSSSRVAPDLEVFVDPGGTASHRYGVSGFPVYVLVNRDGETVARADGAIDWQAEAMRQALREALAQ
ncbi:MAG: redoxin domain-containing protein [Planctomycetota bacterium]